MGLQILNFKVKRFAKPFYKSADYAGGQYNVSRSKKFRSASFSTEASLGYKLILDFQTTA